MNNTNISPSPRLLIFVLVAAAFVVILNETTLAVALPALMQEFHINATLGQWLTTSFMLTTAVVIPTTGFVMERFTLRAVFITAMCTFLVGTLVAALAPSYVVLLIARIIQALGTALVIPLLMTTIMRLVPVEQRGSMMGFVSVVIAVAPAMGPTYSGFVVEHFTWRWIFLTVFPLALIALLVGLWKIRNFEEPVRPHLDIISVLLSAAGFSGVVFALTGLSQLAEGVPWDRVVIMVASLVVLGVFIARQRALVAEGRSPLLHMAPLANREFVLSLGVMLLSFAALFGYIIVMPLFGQKVVGLSELESGLVTLPGGLLMGLAGPFVGKLYDSNGIRLLVIPGSLLLAGAMAGCAFFLDEGSGLWLLVGLTVLLNLGLALLLTPLMSNALAAVPGRLAPHGQAILNTLQQLAGAAGTALYIAVMTLGSASFAAAYPGSSQRDILFQGIHAAFLLGTGISIVTVLVVVFLRFDVLRDVQLGGGATKSAVSGEQTGVGA